MSSNNGTRIDSLMGEPPNTSDTDPPLVPRSLPPTDGTHAFHLMYLQTRDSMRASQSPSPRSATSAATPSHRANQPAQTSDEASEDSRRALRINESGDDLSPVPPSATSAETDTSSTHPESSGRPPSAAPSRPARESTSSIEPLLRQEPAQSREGATTAPSASSSSATRGNETVPATKKMSSQHSDMKDEGVRLRSPPARAPAENQARLPGDGSEAPSRTNYSWCTGDTPLGCPSIIVMDWLESTVEEGSPSAPPSPSSSALERDSDDELDNTRSRRSTLPDESSPYSQNSWTYTSPTTSDIEMSSAAGLAIPSSPPPSVGQLNPAIPCTVTTALGPHAADDTTSTAARHRADAAPSQAAEVIDPQAFRELALVTDRLFQRIRTVEQQVGDLQRVEEREACHCKHQAHDRTSPVPGSRPPTPDLGMPVLPSTWQVPTGRQNDPSLGPPTRLSMATEPLLAHAHQVTAEEAALVNRPSVPSHWLPPPPRDHSPRHPAPPVSLPPWLRDNTNHQAAPPGPISPTLSDIIVRPPAPRNFPLPQSNPRNHQAALGMAPQLWPLNQNVQQPPSPQPMPPWRRSTNLQPLTPFASIPPWHRDAYMLPDGSITRTPPWRRHNNMQQSGPAPPPSWNQHTNIQHFAPHRPAQRPPIAGPPPFIPPATIPVPLAPIGPPPGARPSAAAVTAAAPPQQTASRFGMARQTAQRQTVVVTQEPIMASSARIERGGATPSPPPSSIPHKRGLDE